MHAFTQDFEHFAESWWPYLFSLLISMLTAIRLYFGGTYCDSPSRIDNKIVILTGGSSGIGLETAKELAKRGGKIILAIRNIEKGIKGMAAIKKDAKEATVVLKLLDLSDFTNIRNFVDEIKTEYDKVDILINNAATIAHPLNKSLNGNDITFVTNYLGPFLLTHLLLPLLNNSCNGRVINVSASAHFNGNISIDNLNAEKGFTVKDSFAASKLALTIFTKHMARLYSDTKITFNSANPGLVRGTGHLEKYSSLSASFFTRISMLPWIWLFLKSPNQGCQTIVYLAIESTLHKVSGYFFSECEMKEPSELVNDEELARALYRKSCVVVDLNPEDIKLSSRLSNGSIKIQSA